MGLARVNLNAYFQKIFGAEKELIWFLAHILAQKGAIKQWAIQCLIVLNNRYQLFFGAHLRTKLLCSKMFCAGSTEIHPEGLGHSAHLKKDYYGSLMDFS